MTTDTILSLAQAALADERRGTPGPYEPSPHIPGAWLIASSRTREPQLARAVVVLMDLLATVDNWADEGSRYDDEWPDEQSLRDAVRKARAELAAIAERES